MQTNRYLIALTAALGLIPIALDSTIVTVALTPIRTDLHADVNTVQWIITGYFLANAAVVAVGGYLATRFGHKRLFVIGLSAFTIGSLLCGIAPGIGWLIVFRVLQGMGGGILLPIGPALAFDVFPQEERARASAVIGIPILLAPVFGPILGGYLNDTFGWHSIFFVNLPFCAIAIAAALFVLPRDQRSAPSGARFDIPGVTLSSVGIVAILFAISLVTQTNPATVTAANPTGDTYGWGYWLVWVLLGASALVLGIFALYSLRFSHDPALDLRQLRQRDFLFSNLVSWAAALITFGLLVLMPLYFEAVRLPHLSALDTGVALVPFSLGSLLGTIVATALYRAIGPRWVVVIGVMLSGISAWLLSQSIHPTANASDILAAARTQGTLPAVAGPDALGWWLFLVGMGFVMLAISVQTLALEALKGEALAKASSLVLSTKLIFSSVGVAIITSIFEAQTRTRATDLASQLRTLAPGAGAPGGNAALLRAIQAQVATQAGTWAIQGIFSLIVVGCVVLLVLALFLPGRTRYTAATLPATTSNVPQANAATAAISAGD